MMRGLYLLSFLVIFTLVGCSSLRTASYRGGGDYRSQSDGGGPGPENAVPDSSRVRGPFAVSWPVKRVKINRGFLRTRRPHQGIDFGGQRNDPILAAHEGHVIYTGNAFRGYGKMIIIQYSDTWASLYAHLRQITVQEGDYVYKGDVIGKMGRTGRATGVHLHFELMKRKIPIDPMPILTKNSRLVTR